MSERFFVSTPLHGQTATLEGPEAHHLAHVLRAKPGDEVVLFDGMGHEAAARIAAIGRSRVELTLETCQQISRESSPSITLAVGLPKGDRQRWLVEKAVELGVQRLVPLDTRFGIAEATPSALSRLRKVVIEASKQCGRNWLMSIEEPQQCAAFVAACDSPARWMAHFGGEPIANVLVRPTPVSDEDQGPTQKSSSFNPSAGNSPSEIALAIGSEGGFADDEVSAAAAAGWRILDLGPRILRVDTAATFMVSAARLRPASGNVTANSR